MTPPRRLWRHPLKGVVSADRQSRIGGILGGTVTGKQDERL